MRKWLKIVIAFLYKSFSRVIISHFFYQKCGIIQNLIPITKGYGIPNLRQVSISKRFLLILKTPIPSGRLKNLAIKSLFKSFFQCFCYQHRLHRLKAFPYKPHFYRAQSHQWWDHYNQEWSNNNIRQFSTHCPHKAFSTLLSRATFAHRLLTPSRWTAIILFSLSLCISINGDKKLLQYAMEVTSTPYLIFCEYRYFI